MILGNGIPGPLEWIMLYIEDAQVWLFQIPDFTNARRPMSNDR